MSGRPLRLFLGAFGQPGHAFPMLALGAELARRGHEVAYETWERWREPVEAHGMRFVAAPEYPEQTYRPLPPYDAAARAALRTRTTVSSMRPDVVVHDILTLGPSLAAELEEIPSATLIPHVYPVGQPGLPPYSLGAKPPRTPVGAAVWRALERPMAAGLRRGRDELNAARRRLGLGPVNRFHGGLSPWLCLVATFPQLEYPRRWPGHVHVIGPLHWEPPCPAVDPPPGEAPLVLIATSTAQDAGHRLLRTALAGLAREPVRVLATWNRRVPRVPVPLSANARLVEWLSYSRAMPGCALVVCHAGHGTMARALSCGRPVLAVPHVGDMAENAARLDWAGAGTRLPWPLLSPATLRLAVRRSLGRPQLRGRAEELAAWARLRPAAPRGADLVEELARTGAAVPPRGLDQLRGWDSNPQPNG